MEYTFFTGGFTLPAELRTDRDVLGRLDDSVRDDSPFEERAVLGRRLNSAIGRLPVPPGVFSVGGASFRCTTST
jgi:hypothetical protein